MWACAALQNLAASYCSTENDGRCYWHWPTKKENHGGLQQHHVVVNKNGLPMKSNGEAARKQVLDIPGLVQGLIDLACTGPVTGMPNKNNIFPGKNAIVGRDDDNPHLVAWAAAGALKNLALEPSAKGTLEPALPCMCRLKNSPDWLEQLKSQDMMHFMRRGDPCLFVRHKGMCVDHYFVDADGENCEDYEHVTPDECLTEDVEGNIPASQACCECGGGTIYPDVEKST